MQIKKIIRSPRKTLSLEINHAAELILRTPLRASEKTIQHFIESKHDWIEKNLSRAKARVESIPQREFKNGELLPYLGTSYSIEIILNATSPLLFHNKFYLAQEYRDKAKPTFERWYRHQAYSIIHQRMHHFNQQMQLEFSSLKLNAAKTRWGSCSSNGRLNFNWRLIMAPLEVLDYVIVHELSHLKYMNHSSRFWHWVEKFYPNYDEQITWLKQYGHTLVL